MIGRAVLLSLAKMTFPSEGSAEDILQSYFTQINTHLAANPEDIEAVVTDLNALRNKADKDIAEGRMPQAPLISADFRPHIKAVRDKLNEVFGRKVRVSELRMKADNISVYCSIPLPNSTRKNSDALMQWFHVNWASIEPHVKELADQEAPPPSV